MARKKRRILVVDDDEDIIASLTSFLTAGGYEVDTAANGAEGVARATDESPDLIILDILMGSHDGLTAFEELRRDPKTAKIPVIMLTSVNERLGFGFDESDMETHYGTAPEAFMRKPFQPEALLGKIAELLGRR